MVQALTLEAGECNPQSTVQPPRIAGCFILFFIFHFLIFFTFLPLSAAADRCLAR